MDDARRSMAPGCVEPDAAPLQLGTSAPMFSHLGSDGRWCRSDDLVSRGAVMLVFGASDQDLAGLEKLRAAFDQVGVRPVAVLHLPTRKTTSVARRLGLTLSLVSDPMSAIAGLYHSVDPTTGRHLPSYFVVDSDRTVRAMYYGPMPPAELLLACSARGLGRPLPASVFTTTEAH